MDKIAELLQKCTEIEETLKKTINESYGAEPNIAKDDAKGVHVSNNPNEPGRSQMGLMTRLGENEKAKDEAKAKLKEMKRLPKPKLVKEELSEDEVLKAHENGQWYLNKSVDESLEKGKARKERREVERNAKMEAMKAMPVKAVSHADAISGTHGYDEHHHDLDTGAKTTKRVTMDETKIRNRNPEATHVLHLPGGHKIPVSKDVADHAAKHRKFNFHAWSEGGKGTEGIGD